MGQENEKSVHAYAVMEITLPESTGCDVAVGQITQNAWSSPARKKYSAYAVDRKSTLQLPPSCPAQRALAIVTNVGAGCGGRGSVGRARCSQGRSSVSEQRRADERRLNAFAGISVRQHMSRSKRFGWRKLRTAKAVWFWHPWLVSSWRRFVEPNRASMDRQSVSDGGKRNSSPGRARHKP